jgi:cytochrome c peroxidase
MRKAVIIVSFVSGVLGAHPARGDNDWLNLKEWVGKQIFFDQDLSLKRNQACAVCHGRAVGWTGPDLQINLQGAVYEGSVHGRFGNRKPPTSGYATLAPLFTYDPSDQSFRGGEFWDGRATGWKLGNPAADQAQGPFLNPVEQALPDAGAVVHRVCHAWYSFFFRQVWGKAACRNVDLAYDDIGYSIAAYEGSPQVSPFSSKYDAYLAGWAHLTREERRGLRLFEGKAKCANCHAIDERDGGEPPLFTDFTYDNLGVPRNPENPYYEMDKVFINGVPINPLGHAWIDLGLGEFLRTLATTSDWRTLPYLPAHDPIRDLQSSDLERLARLNDGKQRVPTLRNVDKRPYARFPKAYTHNGYFKSLEALVHFYNTRDVLPRCPGDFTEAKALAHHCWPAPEVDRNVNDTEVGNLGLTDREEDALVAFLGTLSDGWDH